MSENTTIQSKLKRNMPTLIILIISGALIYALPYFRSYYYDTFVKYFHITNTQMGALGSAFGGFSVIAYCLGGFCADRWPARQLMTISLVTTGILGFVLMLYPPYPVVFIIHCAWGITSILTFWSALVKAIRSLAGSDEQGKAFGFFEGGRGIVNMVQSAIILALFGYLSKAVSDKVALTTVMLIYSIICILLGIMVFVLYKGSEEEVAADSAVKKKLFDTVILKRVVKMPTTWLMVLIIFCSYAMIISYFYITPYATAVFGTSAVIAAAMGYMSQYCRPIGCFLSGIAGDKIGSSKVAAISFIIMISGIVGVIFTPGKASMIWMLLCFCACIYASMYAIQSMHFAIMEESDYPLEITGTATAIITPLGYSAEFFFPMIAGVCLDKWSGAMGYKVFFGIIAVVASIGLVCVLIWMKITKEKRMELRKIRDTKK
ncbi:MAG: MFS transporter [Lachnospiraceae bacterium]